MSGEIVRCIVSDAVQKKVNLDKDLLAILCCPETKQAVVLADDLVIQKVNGAIERGLLKNKAQKPVTEKLDGGLVRSDNKILYPVREDIPVMLIDEGIPLDQIA
ncbi:MAG: hypothetical protein DYH03_13705 [Nitrospira sp. NTP1]|nr:hypothetical protein [Nitrospira sp. NTP1]